MQYKTLDELASNQHGLVTRSQMSGHFTPKQIRRMSEQGIIVRLYNGVYRVAGNPTSWIQSVHAGVLAVDNSVVSHWSAAHLWGFTQNEPLLLDVSISTTSGHLITGISIHRTNKLSNSQILNGIPVTSPERTLIDIGTKCHELVLERLLETALHRGLITMKSLREEHERIATRGRPGICPIGLFLDRHDHHLEQCESPLERKALRRMRELGLAEPEKQWPIKTKSKSYRFDFAYPELKIAAEVDSREFHARLLAFDYDKEREDEIKLLGWTVFRLTNRNLDAGIHRLKTALLKTRLEMFGITA